MKARTFVDTVQVEVRAGKGGDGSKSFRRESKVPMGGPDGGDGGRGGHVIVRASHDVDSLVKLFYEPHLWAENGVDGSGQKMHGRRGKDLIVRVPCGTEVYRLDSGALLAEVVADGDQAVIAQGGRGGWGNVHFKSAVNQAPERAIPGLPGEEFRARFELKTIADAGLIGFPNAGKSSLLARLSDARPKIGSYPFTTLRPVIGTHIYPDNRRLRIADIPGIIEGAAGGTGLGIDFLKHIARSRILVYLIDMAGCDAREPWEDYRILRREVGEHDPDLLARPALVVANKMDLDEAISNLPRFIQETGVTPIRISTTDESDDGIDGLLRVFREHLDRLDPNAAAAPEAAPLPPSGDCDELTEGHLAAATFLKLDPPRTKRRR